MDSNISIKKALIDNLNSCTLFIKLMGDISPTQPELSNWFKKLCSLLSNFVELLTKYVKTIEQKRVFKNSLLLYLNRTVSLMTFIIDVFTTEYESAAAISEARYFAMKQLEWSLNGLHKMISDQNMEESGESFVKWMDVALNELSEIVVDPKKEQNNLAKLKLVVEEVLCHAMSICQLSLTEDTKKIKGSSQAVLEALESLTMEMSKPNRNQSMCNLFIDACNDKLCMLERRVNTAILKLSLQVFSQFLLPLNQLYNVCLTEKFVETEIDELIDRFDLHLDQILLIGFFAVGCSADAAKVTKMKSSLANLEALEVEFVPALKAVQSDCSLHNVNFVTVLKNFWINEAKLLQKNVYHIIDPSAFIQVIFDQINVDIETIETKQRISIDDLTPVLSNAEVLIDFVPTFARQAEYKSEDVMNHYGSIKIALHELKCAAEALLRDDKCNETNAKRVLKRCRILATMVKRLWLSVMDYEGSSDTKKEEETEEQKALLVDNPFFDHLLSKGRDILKNRSILNHTEGKRNKLFESLRSDVNRTHCRNQMSISKVLNFRRMNFTNCQNSTEQSVELQITEILDAVSDLSRALKD